MSIRNLIIVSAIATSAAGAAPADAAESYDSCTYFVTSLPVVIESQGVWCLRNDLAFAPTSGNAIEVKTNNATIECNGFKIGNLAAGAATQAIGIRATDRLNTTVRGCNLRGFRRAIQLTGNLGSHGSMIEDNRVEGATGYGIMLSGDNAVVRRNQVFDIGPSTAVTLGHATGISISGMGEISDNTVAVVESTGEGEATGIEAAEGSTIRGNRVRGITASSGHEAAIYANGQLILVAGNDLIGRGTPLSIGILCPGLPHAVRDNVIGGFGENLSCLPSKDNLTFDLP